MSAQTKTNGELDAVKKDIAKLHEDIRDLSSALLTSVKGKADDLGDKISDKAADGRDSLHDLLLELRDRSEDARETVAEQVKDHPTASLLSAFGVGFLVAKLLKD